MSVTGFGFFLWIVRGNLEVHLRFYVFFSEQDFQLHRAGIMQGSLCGLHICERTLAFS